MHPRLLRMLLPTLLVLIGIALVIGGIMEESAFALLGALFCLILAVVEATLPPVSHKK